MKEKKGAKNIHLPLIGDLAVSLGRTVFGIVLGLIASGVLISCPAFVTNCFCFSMFSAMGRIAFLDNSMTKSREAHQHKSPMAADKSSTRMQLSLSSDTSRHTTWVRSSCSETVI